MLRTSFSHFFTEVEGHFDSSNVMMLCVWIQRKEFSLHHCIKCINIQNNIMWSALWKEASMTLYNDNKLMNMNWIFSLLSRVIQPEAKVKNEIKFLFSFECHFHLINAFRLLSINEIFIVYMLNGEYVSISQCIWGNSIRMKLCHNVINNSYQFNRIPHATKCESKMLSGRVKYSLFKYLSLQYFSNIMYLFGYMYNTNI